ncbi:MAG: hypothetical protein HUK00_04635 [Bacteroidaceae bacterium]|nr:hypothetical protein [Bacteroidaceae bacterium]
MRKLLLVMSCVVAMGASAQQTKKLPALSKPQPVKMERQQWDNTATAVLAGTQKPTTSGPRRAAAEDVYYKTPAGSMWVIVDQPLYSYTYPYQVLAPWTDFVYENMSLLKDGRWFLNLSDGEYDISEYADEDNNYWDSCTGGEAGYYAPNYEENGTSYVPSSKNGEMINYVMGVEFISPMATNIAGGGVYTGGSLQPNKNLYGAGYIEYTDQETGEKQQGTALGILYTMRKPMSNLYVEKVGLWGSVNDVTLEAMPEGTELTMQIYNKENPEAEPVVLTCKGEDLVFTMEYSNRNFYMVNFTQKVLDPISGEEQAVPFVIDYEAEIDILGFDQEGVNLNILGVGLTEEFLDGTEDNPYDQAYFMVRNEVTGDVRYHYYSSCLPVLGFYGMFEVINVTSEAQTETGVITDLDGMVVSADGATCTNYVDATMPGVEVLTALDWTNDETGEDRYWSDDMYDYEWINNLVLTQFTYSDGEPIGGAYAVAVECQPLPAGETVRYACIHITGNGVTSAPIYIIQGEGTIEECKRVTAVNSIKAVNTTNDKFFNIAGQNVKKTTKGLIINNGKKHIVK